MGAYYDEVEIEDMVWDEERRVHHYPWPASMTYGSRAVCAAVCRRSLALSSCSALSSTHAQHSPGRRRIPPALTRTAGSVCCTTPCAQLIAY